jgi:hypothetical protein
MQSEDPSAKAIVFSQFVNMLDLLDYRLQVAGFRVVKLSGHLTVDQRDKVLKSFREDAKVTVLLMSLKAGGVALNLTVANHIFLMDPWWCVRMYYLRVSYSIKLQESCCGNAGHRPYASNRTAQANLRHTVHRREYN